MAENKTVIITIDDQKIEAPVNQPILQTALDHGIPIPYFCYFADLMPDGNCRMCLVEIEKIKKPVISCLTYPTEGMIVRTQTDKVKAARKSVLEFILRYHPLDCPICDKVGECLLQANYFDHSGEASHVADPYTKLRSPKLQKFSDRILFDGERCIKCARCTRFTTEVSKTYWLGLVDRGEHSTVAAIPGIKDNYSDCVADLCPVGALTTTAFRFKARVFTLQSTQSVCTLCSRGCNTVIQHKHNEIYRVMPRRNVEVNKSWMCNAGRDLTPYLGRPRCSTARQAGKEVPYPQAIEQFKTLLGNLNLNKKKAGKVLAIASTFGSDQEQAAFVKLFRDALTAEVLFKTDSTLYREEYPADQLLITGDKNPNRYPLVNTYKLQEIGNQTPIDNLDLLVVWGEGLANNLWDDKRRSLLTKAKTKVLLTPFEEAANSAYDLVIPVPTFVEKTGTFTNVDGKTSRFLCVMSLYPHLKDESTLFDELRLAVEKT